MQEEVAVDTGTGQVTVEKLVMAVDCGTAINPVMATGQIEGGLVQALGYAVCEEMVMDAEGRQLATRLGDYRIFAACVRGEASPTTITNATGEPVPAAETPSPEEGA